MNSTRKMLGAVLAAVFAVAMIMGTGPGILLVNTPEPLWGLPAIYAWGLIWYAVQVAVVVLAYVFVWRGGPAAPPIKSAGEPEP